LLRKIDAFRGGELENVHSVLAEASRQVAKKPEFKPKAKEVFKQDKKVKESTIDVAKAPEAPEKKEEDEESEG